MTANQQNNTGVSTSPAGVPVPIGQPVFPATAFGAVGDGVADDTAALQRAIDACAAAGGGRVLLHNGRFLSGTLELRSHVELHLTSSAVLLGSVNLADYRRDLKMPYRNLNRALVYAADCEHVAVTGDGVLDGQGAAFATDQREAAERPALIRLRACRNVRVEGVLLKDSGTFALHTIQCRQVRIDGLRIDSLVMPCADGIDIDGCQDVFVANCNIHSDDDCIALKTLEKGHPCRDVVITNCILSSHCAAIRIGPDALENIERVSVSNCVIRDTRLNGIKIQELLNNVRFRVESEDRRPAIVCDDVQDLELAGFKAQGHPESESLIRLENTRRAFISHSRPLGEVKTLVRVEGAASAGIELQNNLPAGA